jgi:ketosteroid isomerase-like protein
MAHPNEELLRSAYRLFAAGDIPGFLSLCTPDITFRIPGSNPLSGQHARDAFLGALGPAMERTNRTFRETVLHLAANDSDGFVLVAQQLERDGQLLRWNSVHRWSFQGGKLASFWEFTDDEKTYDLAWR